MKQTAGLLLVLSMVLLEGCVTSEHMDALTGASFGFNASETDPHTCEKLSSTPARDTCYNTVALNTQDYEICNRIASASQKDVCYSGVAHVTRNASVCERISGDAAKADCVQDVLESN